jgi:putative flippase GtrA
MRLSAVAIGRKFAGKLGRFGVVGALSTLIYILVAEAGARWTALPILVVNAAAFTASGVWGYVGHYYLTFRATTGHGTSAARFFALFGLGYAASSVIVFGNRGLGLPPELGIAAVAICIPAMNFLVMQLWVFADRSDSRKSNDARSSSVPRLSSREIIFSCGFLTVLVFFANFTRLRDFTLYSDDWGYLRFVFLNDYSFRQWLDGVIPYSDARPLQYGLINLTGAAINLFGTLAGGYILLFVITALSVVATWWALTYRFSQVTSLLAAAVFAMTPLISIRPFLNSIASPATFIFLMVATIFYISRRRVLAYATSILILLCYELMFPLFILLPALLDPLRTRRDCYRFGGHLVICAALLGLDAVYKSFYGEARLGVAVSGHGLWDLGIGIVSADFASLARGALGSVDIPLWLSKIEPDGNALIWGAAGFVAFLLCLYGLARRTEAPDGSGAVQDHDGFGAQPRSRSAPSAEFKLRIPSLVRVDLALTAQALAVLVAMILAGYLLVYFVSPGGAYGVLDRDSRYHTAASLPFSIVTGMALAALLRSSSRASVTGGGIGVGAGYLALLFAFSVSHQDEFAAAAEQQRQLVIQLVRLHPKIDPQGTFILEMPQLDRRHFPSIGYIDGHTEYFVLRGLFDFSKAPGQPVGPGIRKVFSDAWPQMLIPGPDGEVVWPWGTWPPYPEHVGHVWRYRRAEDGVLTPLSAPVIVGGRNILHEGPDDADGGVDLGSLPRYPLFREVMRPDLAQIEAALHEPADAPGRSAH